MQFKQGVSVYTLDGKEAGHVDRVVLEPKTNEITHLVIRKGLLIKEDKVVPVGLVEAAKEERVTLRLDREQLEQLPNFEETDYVPLTDDDPEWERARPALTGPVGVTAPAMYWYPAYGGTPLPGYPASGYVAETRTNIPEGTVAVKTGAKVVTRDDKDVGDVVQLLTDLYDDRVTHCLISKGLLLKEKKLIPVGWIESWSDDEVRLSVGAKTIERLPVFEQA
jgi:uncharacterized protein YrrD